MGSEKCEVWSVKCGVWSFSLECEERSVKCEVWGLECEGSSEKWEVWSVECEVWSLECEVWSVECEDFASSLAEKIKRLSREGHGRDRVSLNYRSFMFGKLPPPACPGLCYGNLIVDGLHNCLQKKGSENCWLTSRTPRVMALDLGEVMINHWIWWKLPLFRQHTKSIGWCWPMTLENHSFSKLGHVKENLDKYG